MKLIKKAIKLADLNIKNKNYKEAELICEQILKVNPENLDVLYLLSISKYKLSKKEEFKECFEKIIKLTPNDFNANNSLGLAHLYLGDLDKSIEHFKKAVELEPKNPLGWSNLGCQLRTRKNYFEAIRCLNKANKLSKEKDTEILLNLAGAYGESLDLEKSIKLIKKAIEISPKLHRAHVDLGCAYFLLNDYKKAWKHYAHRFYHFDYLKSKLENFNKNKKWKGQKIKDGKTILFFCEQGLGDSINFIRFLQYFKELFPKVIVKTVVPGPLFDLFSKNFEGISKHIEEHDYWCSIMDIPYYLNIEPEQINNKFKPYIKETKNCDYSKFKDLYKIGICWAGNPMHPKDEDRSCQLSYFKEIYKIPNVKLFSLQKDLRKRIWPFFKDPVDLSDCADVRIVNMESHMNNWEDTAAIIAGLDLVISVDTSVLHLSGSMGKKTFALIPNFPDWRWGLESSDTFWYPTMKLFRQKSANDWYSVFYEVKKEINMNI